jgi:hypothetical protein
MASHSGTPTEMQVMLYQQTAAYSDPATLDESCVSGGIDGQAYTYERAKILDHYLCVTDPRGNMALTISRLERMRSFGRLSSCRIKVFGTEL